MKKVILTVLVSLFFTSLFAKKPIDSIYIYKSGIMIRSDDKISKKIPYDSIIVKKYGIENYVNSFNYMVFVDSTKVKKWNIYFTSVISETIYTRLSEGKIDKSPIIERKESSYICAILFLITAGAIFIDYRRYGIGKTLKIFTICLIFILLVLYIIKYIDIKQIILIISVILLIPSILGQLFRKKISKQT